MMISTENTAMICVSLCSCCVDIWRVDRGRQTEDGVASPLSRHELVPRSDQALCPRVQVNRRHALQTCTADMHCRHALQTCTAPYQVCLTIISNVNERNGSCGVFSFSETLIDVLLEDGFLVPTPEQLESLGVEVSGKLGVKSFCFSTLSHEKPEIHFLKDLPISAVSIWLTVINRSFGLNLTNHNTVFSCLFQITQTPLPLAFLGCSCGSGCPFWGCWPPRSSSTCSWTSCSRSWSSSLGRATCTAATT